MSDLLVYDDILAPGNEPADDCAVHGRPDVEGTLEEMYTRMNDILTKERCEKVCVQSLLDVNLRMNEMYEMLMDGGSEMTRLQANARKMLVDKTVYRVELRHGVTAEHVIGQRGKPFQFNGKPLRGDNVKLWEQSLYLSLSGSKESAVKDVLTLFTASRTQRVRSSGLQELCDRGHPKYDGRVVEWELEAREARLRVTQRRQGLAG